MADPNMTVPEALAWIISRDDAFSASCRSLSSLGFAAALAIHKDAVGAQHRTLKAAEQALESKCRHGRIVSSGFRGNSTAATALKRTRISQMEWIDLRFVDGHILGAKKGSYYWYDIMFSRSDMMDQYRSQPKLPPRGAVEPTSSPEKQVIKPKIATIALKVKNSHQSKAFEASIKESFPAGLPEGIIFEALKDALSKSQEFKLRGLKLDKLKSGGYDVSLKRLIGRAKS
jgi:hypothetical protein